MKARLGLVFSVAAIAACSSEPEAGMAQGGNAGTSVVPAGGSAGSGTSTAGTGNPAGGAGAGGTASAGDGGTYAQVGGGGGAGGSGGAGGGSAGAATGGASATSGTQADPGTEGDGTFAQPPPYNLAPESQVRAAGAPQGMVSGPFIHTQTGTYTGWSQWKFTYYVYVPAQYKPGHPAALMIFNDGYLYAGINSLTDSRFNAPMVFDNLMFEGSMPTTIAVFIFPGTNDGHQVGGGDGGRSTQYDTPNDQYGKFLREEFLPSEILNKYDIVTDPDGWAIGGHSSGGIASIIAGWYHPDRWHKMLTASPSFPNKGGKFPDEFNTVPEGKPLRIYHLAGTNDLGGFKAANDKAATIFAQLKYHYRYRPGEDNHYPPKAAMADFPNALRWLWRGYKTPP